MIFSHSTNVKFFFNDNYARELETPMDSSAQSQVAVGVLTSGADGTNEPCFKSIPFCLL